MKYIKKFESKLPELVLYKNNSFSIVISDNDSFTYYSTINACSAIMAMARLVAKKSKYLEDEKLRNVKIRTKDKVKEIEYMDLNTMNRRENIRKYRSGEIGFFIDTDFNKSNIPIEVYMELTEKYYPIIIDAIASSNTLGDIIDKFTVIYNKLIPDVNLYMNMNKYNL